MAPPGRVQLGVEHRGDLLGQRPVALLGPRQPPLAPGRAGFGTGDARAPGAVEQDPGQLAPGTQQLGLGVADHAAWLAPGHSQHPDHRAAGNQRHAQPSHRAFVAAVGVRRRPAPGHGQRRAGLPDIAGQPFPLAKAPADGGGEAADPPAHHQPRAIVIGQPEERVTGAGEPRRPGHDEVIQVFGVRRAGRDRRHPGRCPGGAPRPFGPGVDAHGRHAPSSAQDQAPFGRWRSDGWRETPDTLSR